MTLQDFLNASNGDDRLAVARWLYGLGNGFSPYSLTLPEYMLKSTNGNTDYLIMADAVLAELARQRKESWEDGFETGMHTPSCFSSNS